MIDKLIDQACFTEQECDTATSGLCASFALALARTLADHKPQLVLVRPTRNGRVLTTGDGCKQWRHAAVLIDGRIYDIEGEQKIEWLAENYLWGVLGSNGHAIDALIAKEFMREVKQASGALDRAYYLKMKQRLAVVLKDFQDQGNNGVDEKGRLAA